MNKRGEESTLLGKELVRTVISVIGILILFGLLVSLYFSAIASQKLEQAKSSLNLLMSEINSGKEKVQIYNPKGWFLGTWPHRIEVQTGVRAAAGADIPKTELKKEKPQTCYDLSFQKCICLCPENKPGSCDNNGICLNNPQGFEIVGDVITEQSIELTNLPITLNIDQTNKKISGGGF